MKIILWLVAIFVLLPLLAATIYAGLYTSRVEARFPAIGKLVGATGHKVHVLSLIHI